MASQRIGFLTFKYGIQMLWEFLWVLAIPPYMSSMLQILYMWWCFPHSHCLRQKQLLTDTLGGRSLFPNSHIVYAFIFKVLLIISFLLLHKLTIFYISDVFMNFKLFICWNIVLNHFYFSYLILKRAEFVRVIEIFSLSILWC